VTAVDWRTMTARSLSLSMHSGRVPTSEELGEALLNAAAAGNRSKLKKLLDAGMSLCAHWRCAN